MVDNPIAFPVTEKSVGISGYESEHVHLGMTLRDYFAAHAPEPTSKWMEHNVKNVDWAYSNESHIQEQMAKARIVWAYVYADLMLEARNAK